MSHSHFLIFNAQWWRNIMAYCSQLSCLLRITNWCTRRNFFLNQRIHSQFRRFPFTRIIKSKFPWMVMKSKEGQTNCFLQFSPCALALVILFVWSKMMMMRIISVYCNCRAIRERQFVSLVLNFMLYHCSQLNRTFNQRAQ